MDPAKGSTHSRKLRRLRWANALNSMTSTAVGLYPLPVELWEEIFSLATEYAPSFKPFNFESCMSIQPFFTDEEEGQMQDPKASRLDDQLRTRHAIILVCKSWYYMGIPALWSHLKVQEKDDRDVVTSAFIAMKRNPDLASFVVRITVAGLEIGAGYSPPPGGTQSIAAIIPLLTNLATISCPFPYAARLQPSLRSKVMIVYGDDKDQARAHRRFWTRRLTLHDYIWHQCTVLSFAFTRSTWEAGWSDLIYFNSLTDLRLNVTVNALRWIIERWKLPKLKNLSLITTYNPQCVTFLQQVRLTLETVQLQWVQTNIVSGDVIEMPNLRNIYMVEPINSAQSSRTGWYSTIQAPVLNKCVLLLGNTPFEWQDDTYRYSIEYINNFRCVHQRITHQ